jgi:acyl-coenzyme A thioesterase PaaI-like protein
MTEAATSRQDAAGALRRLVHAFVGYEADDDLLRRIGADADALRHELESAPRRERLLNVPLDQAFVPPPASAEAWASSALQDRAIGGPTNPTAIETQVRFDEDEVIASFTLGEAFEGAPGRAHGGVVAAVFDDVTGHVLRLAQTPAFTGRLCITYRAPTPVGEPLEIRSRLAGREGRKLLIVAECRASGEVLATAEATYITVDREQFQRATEG